MKKLSLFVLAILSSISIGVQAHGFSREDKMRIVQAYGYIRAQNYIVNYIENKYPNLLGKTLTVKNNWNSRYPHAKEAVVKHLKCFHLENPALENFLQKDKSFIKSFNIIKSQAQSMSEYDANQKLDYFIGRIKNPSGYDREISLILNDLVFDDHPEMEFFTDKRTYSTKGHQKSIGLDLQISVPASWKQSEAVRPHIVQKWTKKDDHGMHSIMILIRDIPDMYGFWTQENLAREIKTGELWEIFSNENIVSRQKMSLSVIEKIPCAMVQMVSKKERAGNTAYIGNNILLFGIGSKMISIELLSFSEDQAYAESSLNKYSALAKAVFNSVYMPDRW